jgi:hypothetical protein
VPPQNPLTRLQQVAVDLGRFADALEATTDLDARVLRYWQAELVEIAADLQDSAPQAGGGVAQRS